MVNSNQNQKFYFPGVNKIIVKILEKNNLKETIEEAIKKIEQKKDCLINIIYDASRDFAEGKILEKDLAIHLQKQIGTSAQTAESLVENIKEKLLPLATKANIGETETEKPIAVKPVRLINETQDIDKKNTEVPQIAKKLPDAEKKEKKKKDIVEMQENEKISEVKEIKRQPRKKDSYLEPIE